MTFEIGRSVELNALGRTRIEGNRPGPKNRRKGMIVGISKAYKGSYRIKWATRKTVDQLHGDFIMDAANYVEPAGQQTNAEKVRGLLRTDDGDPFNAGFNAALSEVLEIL